MSDSKWLFLYKNAGLSLSRLWHRFPPFNVESQKMHLRHVMLHCFKKGNSAKDTTGEIFTVYGSGTTTIRTVGNWFKKFRAGNFELKDEDRSGRPATTDTDIIKTVLTENPRYSVREIVDATNIPKTTVHEHLIKIGYANRYEVWVPHLQPVAEKRPELANRGGVVFHHDNARPHVALVVRQKLLQFSLKNSLRGKSFKSISEIKTHLDEYFTSKLKQFWKEGMMRLPERWKKIMEQNGSYIT
ncbi:Histone-lysine N-methyltransferase SETMAR [Melipona quadrifasciata]|uniref:Histone-lysine N-methyltransferase SETMAR n=1 Tax=Melipona quadrifasciata TaxID=166423 RepID=A0A0M8ZP16_9HYME|nr:Histone-lysine N-methyltransferase SETMAR [Melipona quadrifasciata]